MREQLITIKRKDETIALTAKEVSEAMEELLLNMAYGAIDIICESHGYKISEHDREIIANKAEYGAYMSIMADVKKRVEFLMEKYDKAEEAGI